MKNANDPFSNEDSLVYKILIFPSNLAILWGVALLVSLLLKIFFNITIPDTPLLRIVLMVVGLIMFVPLYWSFALIPLRNKKYDLSQKILAVGTISILAFIISLLTTQIAKILVIL